MAEQVKDMGDEILVETYHQLHKLRNTNFRIYGEANPWIDERVDEIADEIGKRGLELKQ